MAAATSSQSQSQTAHLINAPSTAVEDALQGLCRIHPKLSVSAQHKAVFRSDIDAYARSHVTVVACAGGGHEPMFSGFVGTNFLSASVSGSVFASPTASQIFAAIEKCSGPHGTLLVVGNYTGDVLMAGLAVTRATAAGRKVRLLPVGDDVAVGRAKGGKVGRRGLCAHILALKTVCALAEKGADLDAVVTAAGAVVSSTGTIAVSFDRVALPVAIVTPLPTLAENTVELGMGAHGEPGCESLSPVPEPPALVRKMLGLLCNREDEDRGFIDVEPGDEAVVLVNSLGGLGHEVLGRFCEMAVEGLEERGIKVVRAVLGPFVTSLRMSGFGITIWRLPRDGEGDSRLTATEALECFDLGVDTVSWKQ